MHALLTGFHLFAEPSLAAKENAQALKEDPAAAKELKEVDKAVGGTVNAPTTRFLHQSEGQHTLTIAQIHHDSIAVSMQSHQSMH